MHWSWIPIVTLLSGRTDVAPSDVKLPDALSLAETVVEQGCQPRLVGSRSHPFLEAQIACDGFLALRLTDEVLYGLPRAPRVEALRALLADALSSRTQAPFRSTTADSVAGHRLPRSILYRGYLLLMLAGKARIDALSPEEKTLWDALALRLAEDQEVKRFWPSFGAGVWPCDHALAASALWMHGTLTGNARTAAAGETLRAAILAEFTAANGLVTKTAPAREDVPRGTVEAWTAAFLRVAFPDSGAQLAHDFVERFCDAPLPGVVACREWPRGVDRPADAVSGPLHFGYGTGASALGLVATRDLPDLAEAHAGLWQLAVLGGLSTITQQPIKRPLENAILLWAQSVRSWRPVAVGTAARTPSTSPPQAPENSSPPGDEQKNSSAEGR